MTWKDIPHRDGQQWNPPRNYPEITVQRGREEKNTFYDVNTVSLYDINVSWRLTLIKSCRAISHVKWLKFFNVSGTNRVPIIRVMVWRWLSWVVAPCKLVWVYQRFRGLYCLHHQGNQGHVHLGSTELWALMMEAVQSSRTSVNSYQFTWCYNPWQPSSSPPWERKVIPGLWCICFQNFPSMYMLGLMFELNVSQWGLVGRVKCLLCFGLPGAWMSSEPPASVMGSVKNLHRGTDPYEWVSCIQRVPVNVVEGLWDRLVDQWTPGTKNVWAS
jgi:hypothetical protein